MKVTMENESLNDNLISQRDKFIECHETVTTEQQAVIIQKAWRKFKNESMHTTNNNDTDFNLDRKTITTEEKPISSDNFTIENSLGTDKLSENSLEMSLSSYSNTDESFQSNLDSAAEDLHSDYDSSSCGREYILNAEDDRNNNYFPNLEHDDKESDSANSSYYGSVEDALDEIGIETTSINKTAPVSSSEENDTSANSGEIFQKNSTDKTTAILNYLQDQKHQTYDKIGEIDTLNDETKVLNITENSNDDDDDFARENYHNLCNQQKLEKEKKELIERDESLGSSNKNPFGSDFSKLDVNGKEFAKICAQISNEDLITWDSVNQSSGNDDAVVPDNEASVDLITGDVHDEVQTEQGLEAKHIKSNNTAVYMSTDETCSRKSIRNKTAYVAPIFPDVIGPRSPANIKKECAAMLQKKLANEADQNNFVYRSKSTVGHGYAKWANVRKTSKTGYNGDRMRRSISMQNDYKNKRSFSDIGDDFDVYNIETAMPKIDWDRMERNLVKSAKEQELYHKRRNDREEIRRKLAMGSESDEYYGGERMTKKPSLTTRLQSGMNLQICFMNETASDQDSLNGDHDMDNGKSHNEINMLSSSRARKTQSSYTLERDSNKRMESRGGSLKARPSFFKESLNYVFNPIENFINQSKIIKDSEDVDFMTKQARLQSEARMALAQAKEMAHMQMEIEKQNKKKSPIAEMVGIDMPYCQRRLTRQVLTRMNVAQLQVIVNDLHTQIETLNEDLVKFLLDRDDLHMEQDSMLVDIEDLNRYLGDKEEVKQQKSVSKKFKKKGKK